MPDRARHRTPGRASRPADIVDLETYAVELWRPSIGPLARDVGERVADSNGSTLAGTYDFADVDDVDDRPRRDAGHAARYPPLMLRVRGRVERGRLVIDEPVGPPQGSEVDVVVVDDEGWTSELDDALTARAAEADRGELHSFDEVLARLRDP